MSRTFRRTRSSNGKNVRDGKQGNWNHDLTVIRRDMNNSFREEEKQYFKKFNDKKVNQPSKSRGYTQ